MAGGLAGSPIVDGNGANLKISVPMARPAQPPLYEQFSVQDNTTIGVSNGISPSITPGAAEVTGSISYANGDTVVLGSQATLPLDKKNTVRKKGTTIVGKRQTQNRSSGDPLLPQRFYTSQAACL
jgi:hypothetical protein